MGQITNESVHEKLCKKRLKGFFVVVITVRGVIVLLSALLILLSFITFRNM